jgi:phosphatidate phosphatase APP1
VGTAWNAQLRGWVHEDRKAQAAVAAKLLKLIAKCDDTQVNNVRSRSADIMDDNKKLEKVEVKFDSDPGDQAYSFIELKHDGIVTADLVLTDEKAKQLLEKQGSDPNGLSLVSDIDDTIKITEVPAGQPTVLRNTFCLDFRTVHEPDMAAKYKERGDIPVHYVSGGPEQLFGPLYDFLITGPGGFPEGTFHLKFFSTHPSIESTSNLMQFLGSSLQVTYEHKLDKITTLMDRFPNRKFILVGDSGEIDPEVYNEIKKNRPAQVKEIWIRDVINDDIVNHFRLAGMTVIPVNPPICIADKHFEHLSAKIKQVYPKETYVKNPAPPCSSQARKD